MNPDIYKRTVRGKPINPAIALYQAWAAILNVTNQPDSDGNPRGYTLLGHDRGWGIGAVNDILTGGPALGFGHVGWNQVQPLVVINAKGEFQLRHMYGYSQRKHVDNETFLKFDFYVSRYQWFIDPEKASAHHRPSIRDWERPTWYASEHVMRCTWDQAAWLRLVPEATGWAAEPSRNATPKSNNPNAWAQIQADFQKQERLRLRRYRLLERDERIRRGEIKRRSSSAPLTEEAREERREKQALAIMAHFDVMTPAKTTPLRKKEALCQPSG